MSGLDARAPSHRSWPTTHAFGLTALFVTLLFRSWGTWPDPIIDFGRELYVPWQLSEGRVLFTEVAWFNGPLSPNWNRLMFEIFGVSFRTLVLVNTALFALVIATLYRLLRRFSGPLAAFAGCSVVQLVCGFGQLVDVGNYNFIAPYSHEITHGILFGLLATECALGSASDWRLAGAAGFLVGLAFLTKPEVFVAALAGGGCGVVLSAKRPRHYAAFSGALLVPPAVSVAWLAMFHAPWDAFYFTLGGWPELFTTDVSDSPFHRAGMGLDEPSARVREAVIFTAGMVASILPGVLVARLPNLHTTARAVLAVSTTAAAFFALAVMTRAPLLASARILPLATLAAALLAAARLARNATPESIALLAFAGFALAALAKLGLNARVVQYGFALALPALALTSVCLVDILPRLLAARRFDATATRASAFVLLIGFSSFAWATTEVALRHKTIRVGSGADAFYADARGTAVVRALDWLHERKATVPISLVALPEGVMLNYLARIPNPTPYLNFVPGDLVMFGERNVEAALRSSPPEFLAIVHRDTSEYGSPFFGSDYAHSLGAWIRENYVLAEIAGDPPLRANSEFGIAILERR